MPRRVTLPGASELFRPTDTAQPSVIPAEVAVDEQQQPKQEHPKTTPTHSGRVRHDEKITVYVSREELLGLEQARIELRGEHNLAVDRGRIVRAAIALALEGLASSGADSDLARRLAI